MVRSPNGVRVNHPAYETITWAMSPNALRAFTRRAMSSGLWFEQFAVLGTLACAVAGKPSSRWRSGDLRRKEKLRSIMPAGRTRPRSRSTIGVQRPSPPFDSASTGRRSPGHR